MFPRTLPLMPHEDIPRSLVFVPGRVRVRLPRAEPVDRKDEDVAEQPWLGQSGEVAVARFGPRRLGHGLHDGLRPRDGPADLNDLLVRGLELGDAGAVALGDPGQGRDDFLHDFVHDGMPSASGHGPLAKLNPLAHTIIWLSVQLVVLHSDDGMDNGPHLLWYPVSNRLDDNGVKIAVNAAFRFENHIAQQIGTEDVDF